MTSLIRGSALLNFAELVSSLGGDGEQLLRARSVDPAAPGDFDRFLSSAAAAAVIADAAEVLDCPDFGMRLAREQGIQILGPVAVIIRNAETFASAIDGVSRYLHNMVPPDHVELVRGPRAAVFTLTTTVRQIAHRDQWVEKGLGLAMDAFRLMLGEDFVPLRVTMQHRRIGPLQNYRDMFRCPVEFESDLNSVHLPNHALTQQIRGRDAAALALAQKYLTDIGPDLEVTDHVRDLTQRLLVVNHASLVDAARAMSLHPRVSSAASPNRAPRSRRSSTTYAVNSRGNCPPRVSRSPRSRPCSGTPNKAATPGPAGAGTASRRASCGRVGEAGHTKA